MLGLIAAGDDFDKTYFGFFFSVFGLVFGSDRRLRARVSPAPRDFR
jgi:hypothetical protein